MTIRCLIIFSSSSIGGAEKSLSRMALSDQNRNVVYELSCVGKNNDLFDFWKSEALIQKISRTKLKYQFSKWKLFYLSIFGRHKYDILYVVGYRLSIFVRLLNLFMGFPFKVIVALRWNPSSGSRLDLTFRNLEKYLKFLPETFYIANSNAGLTTLRDEIGVTLTKSVCIHNGVNVCFRAGSTIVEPTCDDKIVLLVGNMAKRKGFLEFLRYFNDHFTELHFGQITALKIVIAGNDYMSGRVQEMVRKSSRISHLVSFMGYVDEAELSGLYRKAAVLAFPSLYDEGCPTAIIEARCYGCKVVAFDIDGVSEVMGMSDSLIRPGNYVGFLEAVRIAINSHHRPNQGSSVFLKSMTHCCAGHENFFLEIVGSDVRKHFE